MTILDFFADAAAARLIDAAERAAEGDPGLDVADPLEARRLGVAAGLREAAYFIRAFAGDLDVVPYEHTAENEPVGSSEGSG